MSEFDAALTYTSYLAIDELVKLQRPLSKELEHDEMLFIIIHQSYELWFKQLIHEFKHAQKILEAGETYNAAATLGRIRTILKVCVSQVDILETMTPLQFSAFRGYLAASSGFQSVQFRMVEAILGRKDSKMYSHLPPTDQVSIKELIAGNSLWDSFLVYLATRGYSDQSDVKSMLVTVHQSDPESAMICERLMDIDEGLQEWRYRHIKMVERTIGHKPGTGGSAGVGYLASTLFHPVFPDLWAIRDQL